jgi:ribosomal protein L7/L12
LKIKEWQLWLFASICFIFVGIMDLIEKKYTMGVVFSLLGAFYIYLSVDKYKGKSKVKQKVVSEIELENMNAELEKLIAEGKNIEAIKKYRMVTGLGLKEAKDYVDLMNEKNK